MNYYKFLDLMIILGMVALVIGAIIIVVLAFPGKGDISFSVLFNKDRQTLVKDYKDPNIKFGGPLGIVKGLLVTGTILLTAGLMLKGLIVLLH